MRRHLSARSRLTLLYASLFTLGGAALVLITYLLVAHTLHSTTTTRIPPVDPARDRAVRQAAQTGVPGAMQQVRRGCMPTVSRPAPLHSAARRSPTC